MSAFSVTQSERVYLRELAKKQAEYASLPIMLTRQARWYRHNRLEEAIPMIVIEDTTFQAEFLPPLKCQSPWAVRMERQLLTNILVHERIGDDRVVPDFFVVWEPVRYKEFSIDITSTHAVDSKGRDIGFKTSTPLEDLTRDLEKLGPSTYLFDREARDGMVASANDILGDILPVVLKCSANHWMLGLTQSVVTLMGMENMLFALYDTPDEFHRLMQALVDEKLAFMRWMQEEGLLHLNNGNDYAGAGSYGFTDELPAPDFTGKVRLCDLWANTNSQESVGISPAQYREFMLPYYRQITEAFGLNYYGCCEAVHTIWEDLKTLPRLRKVSISPWCDQAFMGPRLKEAGVIASRKPEPHFLGVDTRFDEQGLRAHIRQTLEAMQGGHLEFIYRDVYSLLGDADRPQKVVKCIREEIDKHWK